MLGVIVKRIPNRLGAILFIQRANRACCNALAAHDTRHVIERLFEGTSNVRFNAAVNGRNGMDRLHVGAGCHTAAAQNTFVVVPYNGRGHIIQLIVDIFPFKPDFINAHFFRQRLQFAVFVADTG